MFKSVSKHVFGQITIFWFSLSQHKFYSPFPEHKRSPKNHQLLAAHGRPGGKPFLFQCNKTRRLPRLPLRLLRIIFLQKRVQAGKPSISAGEQNSDRQTSSQLRSHMRSPFPGYPIGFERRTTEQARADQAVRDQEELYRLQGKESKGGAGETPP